MRIFIKEHSSDRALLDNPDSPWHGFFEELRESGFEIVDDIEDANCLISNNAPSSSFLRKSKHVPNSRRTLILWESPKIKPSNFSPEVIQEFTLHISPSKEWLSYITTGNVELFNWPHTQPDKISNTWETRSNRLQKFIILSGNNFSNSDQENYTLRRELAFELKGKIDLWGRDWEIGIHKKMIRIVIEMLRTRKMPRSNAVSSFLKGVPWNKGPVTNKFSLMSQYRFGIAIENSSDYVSEKLIDMIISGVAPIYVGPDLKLHGYPENICIRADRNIDDIKVKMSRLMADENLYEEVLKSGQDFLRSKEFGEMINSVVLRKLARQSTLNWRRVSGEDK